MHQNLNTNNIQNNPLIKSNTSKKNLDFVLYKNIVL